MLEFETKPESTGQRLDIVVADMYPEFSRSSLELLFDMGMVFINKVIAKPSYKVHEGDEVAVDESYLKRVPEAINMPIIYEDDDVIVIDKPAGILSHSKGALNLEPSVASFIKNKLNDQTLGGNRAGIVHRLDRGTSGVMITAKNSGSLGWLQKQFSQRRVKKVYRAIAEGLIDPKEAVIEAPIGRNPKKPQTFKVLANGRPATTTYRVLKEFKRDGKNYSEIELTPQTGRTHQLRIHLAYIGHPIVGDPVYGHGGGPIMLHAETLELTLPSKERQKFTSPLPERFKDFANE
jgi:23S rRNA pseudouridine1911/1915/1917 synthase